MKRVIAFTDERPFLAVLILMLVLAVPGYLRVEVVAENARETAEKVEQRNFDRCKSVNQSRRQTRELYIGVITVLDASPEVEPEIVAELEALVPVAAEADQDCDGDGVLTEADYEPLPLQEG